MVDVSRSGAESLNQSAGQTLGMNTILMPTPKSSMSLQPDLLIQDPLSGRRHFSLWPVQMSGLRLTAEGVEHHFLDSGCALCMVRLYWGLGRMYSFEICSEAKKSALR